MGWSFGRRTFVDLVGNFQCIGARRLVDADAGGRRVIERRRRTVVLRAELDARDILEPDERAIGSAHPRKT